ncbi:peptidase [Pseudoflavonifractor sp. 524-17]|uniref:SH3 domain-containing C40 family peptidase n=1 Tax=Pseudoflavonifractor sp. 524-17 TaxID=2304577 RepID=UPI0013796092|nr:SH3 domain-containing C40 family peptidase [Pseudoflavonifractor sp. 524-17]NCE64877.1 peptidase [Pseudoflavonifractor sp. 524-17]
MTALIRLPVCPLQLRPHRQGERADEVLCGYAVEVLEDTRSGWYLVRTPYGYTGYAPAEALRFGAAWAAYWEGLPKRTVSRAFCDVLARPQTEAWVLDTLTRGALVAPEGEADGSGWQKVVLCDGREGYVRTGFLMPRHTAPAYREENALRAALARTAQSYLGTPYRWGGKSPLGIDCSGLTAMAYLLNGITIFRDARIEEGFPIRPISQARMDVGDLLYFPGHVALYLGGGRYIHATARPGSDGVVINSLTPASPDYRADLAQTLTAVGSYFAP